MHPLSLHWPLGAQGVIISANKYQTASRGRGNSGLRIYDGPERRGAEPDNSPTQRRTQLRWQDHP